MNDFEIGPKCFSSRKCGVVFMCVLVLAKYDQHTNSNREVRACYLVLTPLKDCLFYRLKKFKKNVVDSVGYHENHI